MKIAYFGYNALSSCLDLFVSRGDEIACIYTGEDSLYADRVINYARQNQVPLFFSKPDKEQMEALVSAGVDLFFAAEYPWMIPVPDQLAYAVNVHPTMLPEGKGPTPLSWLILELEYAQHAGITFHKMSHEFDGGDILLQKPLELAADETFDTLSAKIYVEAPLLLDQLLSNLDACYQQSSPQNSGVAWPKLSRQDQTVDWNKETSQLLRQLRAYGSLGVYAEINGRECLITGAEGVVHPHDFEPGTVVLIDKIRLVVASTDGLISIARSSLLSL